MQPRLDTQLHFAGIVPAPRSYAERRRSDALNVDPTPTPVLARRPMR
jgi:hypothetical protein